MVNVFSRKNNVFTKSVNHFVLEKYFFLEKGSIQGFLKENFLKIEGVKRLLKKINGLYIIRHGQSLHNYRDLYQSKKDMDPAELKSYLTGNNVYLNSCLRRDYDLHS